MTLCNIIGVFGGFYPHVSFPQWDTAETEIRVPLWSTHNSTVLPLKPGVGLNVAMHASPTAMNFLLSNFFLPGPFNFIYCETYLRFFLALSMAFAGFRVCPRNKIGRPTCHRK